MSFVVERRCVFFFALFEGYCEQALQLSAKYRRHEKFIKIQIENLKQHQSALDYISKLKFEDAIESIRTYGKTLMKEQPKGTTQLLKELTPTPQQIGEQNLPESLINLFMNHPDELLDYLDYAVSVRKEAERSREKKQILRIHRKLIRIRQDPKMMNPLFSPSVCSLFAYSTFL